MVIVCASMEGHDLFSSQARSSRSRYCLPPFLVPISNAENYKQLNQETRSFGEVLENMKNAQKHVVTVKNSMLRCKEALSRTGFDLEQLWIQSLHYGQTLKLLDKLCVPLSGHGLELRSLFSFFSFLSFFWLLYFCFGFSILLALHCCLVGPATGLQHCLGSFPVPLRANTFCTPFR